MLQGSFQGVHQLGPHDADRRLSLGQLYVLSLLIFDPYGITTTICRTADGEDSASANRLDD